MMQIKHHHITASITVFVLGLVFFAQSALAVGITPAILLVEDVLPNSQVEKIMAISRFKADADAWYSIEVGGDASEFIKVREGSRVQGLKGQKIIEFHLTISPGNAAEGDYKATVRIHETLPEVDPSKGNKDAVVRTGSINLAGAEAEITIRVTNKEVEDYEVERVTMGDTEEGSPVGVAFELINKGNVATKIGKMHVFIKERFTGETVYDKDISASTLKLVAPFKSVEQSLITDALLKIGQYVAQVKFYSRKGTEIAVKGDTSFRVWPEGTLAQNGELLSFSADKEGEVPEYKLGEFVKLIGTFYNTGSVHLKPALTIEVFKDNTRLDLLKTDPLFVPVGKTVQFESSYQPKETGEYTVKAYVAFGTGKTLALETKFRVPGQSALLIYGVMGGGTLLVLLVLILWNRHKRALTPAPVPSMPIGSWCPIHKN